MMATTAELAERARAIAQKLDRLEEAVPKNEDDWRREIAERYREEWRARYGYEAPETQVTLHVEVEKLRRTVESIRRDKEPSRLTLIRGGRDHAS
jgi:hypothetical protein